MKDELLDWAHQQGAQFFSDGQEEYYLDFLRLHQFSSATTASTCLQIRKGFDSFYENLLTQFSQDAKRNSNVFSENSVISIFLESPKQIKLKNPTQTDFENLVKATLSSEYTMAISAHNALVNCLHAYLKDNPEHKVDNNFLQNFKLSRLKQFENYLAEQIILVENEFSKPPVLAHQ